ncbi:MAG: hypothetical protein HYT96_00035 [Armatimonadetes bacterium]|nr:hypothetical protein [Armatimonadota bacterium]
MSTARIQIQRSTKRLGELLIEAGVVTSEQLESALEEQKHTGKRLAQIFIDRGLLAKGEAGRWLAHQQGYEYVNLTSEPIDLRIARLLPEPFVRRLMALPIREEGREILVAMADPSDILAIDEVSQATGLRVSPIFTTEADLEWAFGQLFNVGTKVSKAAALADPVELPDPNTNGENPDPNGSSVVVLGSEESPPIIQMVDSILPWFPGSSTRPWSSASRSWPPWTSPSTTSLRMAASA